MDKDELMGLLDDISKTESRISIKKQQKQSKPIDMYSYFCKMYKEAFGSGYISNVAIDRRNIKRLRDNFGEDDLKAIIECFVKKYSILPFISQQKHPRPTVGGLSVFSNSVKGYLDEQTVEEIEVVESSSLVF